MLLQKSSDGDDIDTGTRGMLMSFIAAAMGARCSLSYPYRDRRSGLA